METENSPGKEAQQRGDDAAPQLGSRAAPACFFEVLTRERRIKHFMHRSPVTQPSFARTPAQALSDDIVVKIIMLADSTQKQPWSPKALASAAQVSKCAEATSSFYPRCPHYSPARLRNSQIILLGPFPGETKFFLELTTCALPSLSHIPWT